MPNLTLLIDADDTLWENNIYFIEVIERFLEEMERRGVAGIERKSLATKTLGLVHAPGAMLPP